MRQRDDAAVKRYGGKSSDAPAKASKETPKVPEASEGKQSAEAQAEGEVASGAPSVASMEEVIGRHSREHDEMSKAHMDMMKKMLTRHAEERGGLIGGVGGDKAEA